MRINKDDAHNLKCFDKDCERVSCTDRREMQDRIDKLTGSIYLLLDNPVISGMSARIRDDAKQRGQIDPYAYANSLLK